MKGQKKSGGIRTRLLVNNLAFFCIFIGIVIVVHSSFIDVESSLTQIIDRDVNHVIQNATLGRELTSIFASTQYIVARFGETPDTLSQEGNALLGRLGKLIANSEIDRNNEDLKDALQTFSQQFQALLAQTTSLSEITSAIETIQHTLLETTNELENLVAEKQLFMTLTGDSNSVILEHLPLAIARYREMILQSYVEFSDVKDTHIVAPENADKPSSRASYPILFSLLEDLKARLQTLHIEEEDIATYGAQLRELVDQYMAIIQQYHAAQQHTQTTLASMEMSREQILQMMQDVDETVKKTANTLQNEVAVKIQSSERTIWILSVAFLSVVIVGWWSTMRMTRPLHNLSRSAEQLANGDISVSVEDIRTHDEIGTLSRAFKHLIVYFREMAHTVTEISKGDLDLTVTARSKHDALGNGFQHMIVYLKDMGEFATQVAQGNLRSQITLRSQQDQLGNAFIQMRQGLIDLITEIRARADQISSVSQRVLDASTTNSSAFGHIGNAAEVTSSAMRQVSSSVDEVRINTTTLSTSVEDTSTSISEMITSITHVAENSRKLAEFADETRETMATIVHSLETVATQAEHSKQLAEGTSQDARYGQEAVEQMIAKITAISDVTHRISQTVTRLEQRSHQIGTILDVINDVADQTSLLALNASIIAAQAGVHGRGFAVVAAEIKELATRVGTSTKEIAAIVKSVQQESSEAVITLEQGQKEVESGVMVAREAGEALQKIATSAQNSSGVAAEIAVLVRQQTTASNRVAASIQDVASMVKEIRGATQEQEKNSTQLFQVVEKMQDMASQVARATGEQQQSTVHVTDFMEDVITLVDENMATVKQLGQSAHELAAQADVLKSQVQRFVLPE